MLICRRMTIPQANWTAFKTILLSRHVKLALTLELADLDDGAIFEVVHVPPNKRESSVPGSDSQVTPLMLGAALPPQPPPSGVKREKKDFLPTSSNHHPVDPSHIVPASVQRTTHHLGSTTDTLKLGAPITPAAAALADPSINDVLQDVPIIQEPGFDTTPITVTQDGRLGGFASFQTTQSSVVTSR